MGHHVSILTAKGSECIFWVEDSQAGLERIPDLQLTCHVSGYGGCVCINIKLLVV